LQYAWDHRSEKSHIRKARGIVSLWLCDWVTSTQAAPAPTERTFLVLWFLQKGKKAWPAYPASLAPQDAPQKDASVSPHREHCGHLQRQPIWGQLQVSFLWGSHSDQHMDLGSGATFLPAVVPTRDQSSAWPTSRAELTPP
jgi:hypothetical protein